MKNLISNWLSNPKYSIGYFFFWLFLGFFGWSFSFTPGDLKLNYAKQNVQARNTASYQATDSADTDLLEQEIAGTEDSSKMNPEEHYNLAMKDLEGSAQEFDPEAPFVSSLSDIENYEMISEGTLDLDQVSLEKHLKNRKFVFENVSEGDLAYLIEPEDSKTCGDKRNYIENVISKNAVLKDWTKTRTKESELLPRKCIAFAMNSYPEITTKSAALSFKGRNSSMFAKCPKGSSGGPLLNRGQRVGNASPCVSSNLVNLTYNGYVDVTSCLNIDPKDLLPKIYNESGFFINALGGGMDGGIGQLTKPAIDQVNSVYPKYMEEITKAAAGNPNGACARLIKNKIFVTPAKSDVSSRCGLLWPTENPIRNLLYAAILTRYNMKYVSGVSFEAGDDLIVDGAVKVKSTGTASDELTGKMKEFEIRRKLTALGLKNINLHSFRKMITLAGYNSGIGSAMNAFNSYLDQRIAANQRSKSNKYNLKLSDFDFIATKDLAKEARKKLMSSFIKPKDLPKDKLEKVKMRKALPGLWASAYAKSFPEFIVYRLNAYKGDSSGNFQIYGFPGYLTALAEKNKFIRDTFNASGVEPNTCSSDQFLNFQEAKK
ncbi:MAG: hypothetical protein WA160_10385 [Pseudobdellovibrio sp.]